MKIKTVAMPLARALAIEPPKKEKLKKPSFLFNTLVRALSIPDLLATKFTYTKTRMEKVKGKPCLILMNHCSFIDLKIASKIFYPRKYFIISTSDALVGKKWLMKKIGCLPTQKFTADATLPRDIFRAIKEKKTSVLLYPEAGYSFDGRTTTLPQSLGALVKKLNVPVVTVITEGAFLRQPLYNDLLLRKTKISANVECVLTPEEIELKSVAEINAIIQEKFSFDAFKAQAEKQVKIDDPRRAQGLHRVLYRCPACQTEGKMQGENSQLVCEHCGKTYEMDEYGKLTAVEGETEFSHIPDWYDWERACVRKELENKTYAFDLDVDISILCDYNALYEVGKGKLKHDENGFVLTSETGELLFTQKPLASHSVNADFNWYEIGDVICIGDRKRLYYCFPKQKDVVTKIRLAAEELYKMRKAEPKKD